MFDHRVVALKGVIHYQDISFLRPWWVLREGREERSVVLVEKVIKVLSRYATRHENETRLAVVVTAIYTVR